MKRMYWSIRMAAKRVVLFMHLGPVIEYCKDCGIRQPIVWWSDDALWKKVAGTAGILCPACFERRAHRLGLFVRWRPEVEFEFSPNLPHHWLLWSKCWRLRWVKAEPPCRKGECQIGPLVIGWQV